MLANDERHACARACTHTIHMYPSHSTAYNNLYPGSHPFQKPTHGTPTKHLNRSSSARHHANIISRQVPDIIVSLGDPFDRSDTSSFKLTEDRKIFRWLEIAFLVMARASCLLRPGHFVTPLWFVQATLVLSDTVRTCKLGQEAVGVIVSHNTGDTEDTFISDLVVGSSGSSSEHPGAPNAQQS